MSPVILLIREIQSIVRFSKCANVLQTPWRSQRTSLKFLGCRALHVDSVPSVPEVTTSYVHGTSSRSLLSQTIGQTLQNTAERWPDREAVVFLQDGIRKTFAQFQQDVDQAAAGLLALGLKRGDRLGMWGPNIYEWILVLFATAKAGILLVSVNPAYQLQELEFALRKVKCNAIVCPTKFKTQNYCDMLRQLCPEVETATPGGLKSARLPDLRMMIVTDSRQTGMFHMDDVMQAADSQHRQELDILQKKLSFDDPINIMFTSGTTGSPKGATLSHHNLVNNAYFIGVRVGYPWRPQVRACLPVPLYHCFGSVGGALNMAQHGITLVFPSTAYDGRANLESIQKERCTFFYGTPTMFIDLLGQPELKKYDLSSLEAGIMAGSPCPPEIVKKVMTTLNMEVMIGYGTTENSPVTFLGYPRDNLERMTETVGCIMNHTEAKVVDPSTGQIVTLGTSGELMIRGNCVMLDYWDDPVKTLECITKDRWYKTGDLARLDKYGYCRIEGRIKDMIIRGGENIYPAEIEQFLHTHPKVHEVQVVGVRDERMGEEVCACIKLKEGEDCTAEEIKAYCKGQIAHFKIPHYVTFVLGYPLTISGKIQKHKLRAEMEKSLEI
ncbi:medium-chain acyl-CoA ligase ACSF2, mitochondrial-like isoform X1 [Conger conger]|uniref:medium-chain acyl-CoA ligase ACSF2, mitochondrial-like isoform X1 n=1 Tax=Conger conger TaxID=82655 RepID=UPI002A59AB2A|nr:medium-chain acyl-CoA ligase ACSF2, mitochondrial-like isoform X1 [Conger conger]